MALSTFYDFLETRAHLTVYKIGKFETVHHGLYCWVFEFSSVEQVR